MNKKLTEHEKLIRDLYDIRAERDRRAISDIWDRLSDREKKHAARINKKQKKQKIKREVQK